MKKGVVNAIISRSICSSISADIKPKRGASPMFTHRIRNQCIGNIINTATIMPAGTAAIHRKAFMAKSVSYLENNVNAHVITFSNKR